MDNADSVIEDCLNTIEAATLDPESFALKRGCVDKRGAQQYAMGYIRSELRAIRRWRAAEKKMREMEHG